MRRECLSGCGSQGGTVQPCIGADSVCGKMKSKDTLSSESQVTLQTASPDNSSSIRKLKPQLSATLAIQSRVKHRSSSRSTSTSLWVAPSPLNLSMNTIRKSASQTTALTSFQKVSFLPQSLACLYCDNLTKLTR